MHFQLDQDTLKIELTQVERLWAFHLGKTIDVPLAHIKQVTTEEPQSTWRELRAPGTFLPGVIKAGTYYTAIGREFWYVTQDTHYLTLELTPQEYYKKITLTLEDNEAWATRINQRLSAIETEDRELD